jgi:elongation factor G
VTPTEYADFVIRDLRARRGQAPTSERRGEITIVSALVPLATMSGYADDLRLGTNGRGGFTMQFDHYAPAPTPGGAEPFPPAIGMRA